MLKVVKLHCRTFCNSSFNKIVINKEEFIRDSTTNVTPKILDHIGRNIYLQEYHPLSFVRERITNYFYNRFKNRAGNPTFSVFDNLSPVVSTDQNFDSLLVPADHVSRSKSDCYYVNKNKMLRSHMTGHQSELLKMGLNQFLMVGDVYRRDEIDSSHYPVFHQLDAVCIETPEQMYLEEDDGQTKLNIFEKNPKFQIETYEKQKCYTLEASNRTVSKLKTTLEILAKELFGPKVVYKWTDSFFPFTHPSFELEIEHKGKWMEVLGCGVMKHGILSQAGCDNHIGWAFGLGLERLAMSLYDIPDIRLFWSQDVGFTSQFKNKTYLDHIKFKEISLHPHCMNDISFWLPSTGEYCSNDFYELAREVGGDVIEQVQLIDEFKKAQSTSHCYRIFYRSMDRTLTKEEVNQIHKLIEDQAVQLLHVKLR